MNPRLQQLHPYPFEKLTTLLGGVQPPRHLSAIDLSIGEPKHPVPPFLQQTMSDRSTSLAHYPTTRGIPGLRQAAAQWAENRYHLPSGSLDPERHVLPVNGTREALFSFAQCVIDEKEAPFVLMPNPFYQIYEGATLMAGGQPVYLEATSRSAFLPDYEHQSPERLSRTRLIYLCSPSNPTGAVFSRDQLIRLLDLADHYDFIIASDECYSEIWYDTPPCGLLEAAYHSGRTDFRRCIVFHSLSKRSNMPGGRSGFVAGEAALLRAYLQLRTYTGCATPIFIQETAIRAWQDETHVEENRKLYRQKLDDALQILSPVLPVEPPQAGFYLWLRVPEGGEAFAKRLFEQFHVTVLPGGYLGRDTGNGNPGLPYVRIAMVADVETNRQAMKRIAQLATFFDCGCS